MSSTLKANSFGTIELQKTSLFKLEDGSCLWILTRQTHGQAFVLFLVTSSSNLASPIPNLLPFFMDIGSSLATLLGCSWLVWLVMPMAERVPVVAVFRFSFLEVFRGHHLFFFGGPARYESTSSLSTLSKSFLLHHFKCIALSTYQINTSWYQLDKHSYNKRFYILSSEST